MKIDNLKHSGICCSRQWYLGRIQPNQNFDWAEFSLIVDCTLYVHVDQKVSIHRIDDTSGVVIIGIAFNPEALEEDTLIALSEQSHDSRSFENAIIQLAGSYVIIHFLNNQLKIYNDSAGFMGVYFTENAASSTPTLLSGLKRSEAVDLDFEFKAGNDWYTGSTTPYVGVKKLIPNCSLNFDEGSVVRYWPTRDHLKDIGIIDKGEILERIINLLQSMMTGIVAEGNVLASITGGQDSRVILAASKSVWDKINYFTLTGSGVQKDDVDFAKLLAEKAKLHHQVIEITPTEPWLYRLYDSISAGESIGARREIAGTCMQLAGANTIHVNGNLGAICKSYYWDRKKPARFKTSAVLRDFVSPGQITVQGVKEWRQSVSDFEPTLLYNLFYLEQRGGRWMAAGENASRLFYESFTPFNHRKLFLLICSLPLDLQYGGSLLKILAKEMAPELSEIPYCRARRNWTKYIPEKVKIKIRRFIKK